jgi:hypothetical protein
MCEGFEMGGFYTPPLATTVVDVFPSGEGGESLEQLVHQPMRSNRFVLEADERIALFIHASRIQETATFFVSYSFGKDV